MQMRIDADEVAPPVVRGMASRDREYYSKLRRKLRWELLLAYCVPLALLVVYFQAQYSATLSERVRNHLRSLAENQRNTADLFLQERLANIRSSFHPDVLSVPPHSGEMGRLLSELKRSSEAFVDVGLFDPTGKLVAYAGPYGFLLGREYIYEAWYQRLLAPQVDSVVSDVYLGFRGQPHFVVAVKRVVGNELWVLRASVDPDKFEGFISGSGILSGARAYIVNSKGQVQTASAEGGLGFKGGTLPERTRWTSVVDTELEGKHFLRGVAWFTVTEWALVVQVSARDAYAPLYRERIVLAAVVILILACIVAVVAKSTHAMVARLEASDEAQRSLALHLFNAAKLASVGEIAAGVAHEMNNPLAIIHEEASLLLDLLDPKFGQKLEDSELRDRLAAIKEATVRGREISRSLLAFARQYEPQPEPVKLEGVVEKVLKARSLDLRTSNIAVRKEFATDVPEILANANQVEQILLNLLNNARDAIGSNGRIVVRTRRESDWVLFEIEDNGRGMPPEVISKVFFPFFTTKGVGQGTGLGLSISYGIIKSMGGRIELQSQVGVGTTFTLYFPVPNSAAHRPAHKEVYRYATGENPPTGR